MKVILYSMLIIFLGKIVWTNKTAYSLHFYESENGVGAPNL